MNDIPPPESALALVLSSDKLQDLAAEYAELGVDALMESGIARDIALVGSIVSIARIGGAVRDRLFAKKLLEFLNPLSEMSADERRGICAKLDADPDYGRQVGEHLIEILDRIETHRKPRMLARVFRAYGDGEIDATMFHQLVHAIEHLPAFAISELRRFSHTNPPHFGAETVLQLYFGMAGLAVPQSSFDGNTYDPTPVAEAFLRLELDRQE
jgi:hypothetical protein